ncbi:MAG: serine/threonine protein kinase [Waterburya sp.]
MNDYPNLNPYGYKIDAELGRNREGGRITWKGIKLDNQQTVVIKQFCFAQVGSTWSGYKAYEQEIKVLQTLHHHSIPKYLDSIETESGFCLIQEYIPASKLSECGQLNLSQVKQIALNILEVLIYLQQQNPPILHRDLKPDNILLDQAGHVYLIDFGFASLGSQEVSGSSVFKGTPGFIAPEQIIQPTLASDIYSLGVTIVCLLTNKNITEIRGWTSPDAPYQLDLSSLLPGLERQFFAWLAKMIQPQASKRFANAMEAKEALIALDLTSDMTVMTSSQLQTIVQPQIALGGLAILSLSTIAVWGIKFALGKFEPTIINITIALVAAIAITITELGAAAIAQSDQQAKLPAITLGIIIPTCLTILSGWLWGTGEAVSVAAVIAVSEVITLAYFWLQIPTWQATSLKLKLGFLFSAIALGMTLGIKLI